MASRATSFLVKLLNVVVKLKLGGFIKRVGGKAAQVLVKSPNKVLNWTFNSLLFCFANFSKLSQAN